MHPGERRSRASVTRAWARGVTGPAGPLRRAHARGRANPREPGKPASCPALRRGEPLQDAGLDRGRRHGRAVADQEVPDVFDDEGPRLGDVGRDRNLGAEIAAADLTEGVILRQHVRGADGDLELRVRCGIGDEGFDDLHHREAARLLPLVPRRRHAGAGGKQGGTGDEGPAGRAGKAARHRAPPDADDRGRNKAPRRERGIGEIVRHCRVASSRSSVSTISARRAAAPSRSARPTSSVAWRLSPVAPLRVTRW